MRGKNISNYVICVMAIFLLVFYGRFAWKINTVSFLPDEFGYLANAAYLSGTEWDNLSSMFYGYGYSLALIPIFWIASSGVFMIRFAVLLNALCISMTFLLQTVFLRKYCRDIQFTEKNWLTIVCPFIFSFHPFVTDMALYVLPEVYLMLFFWVALVLFQIALKSEKWYHLGFASLALVYTMFIHARAVIFVGAILLAVIMYFIPRRKYSKIAVLGLFTVVFVALGYLVKQNILSNVYMPAQSMAETTITNTLSVEVMKSYIDRMFRSGIKMGIFSLAGKFFYVSISSVGVGFLAVYMVFHEIKKWRKTPEVISLSETLVYGGVIGGLLTFFATVIWMYPRNDQTTFIFYGRYYECLLSVCVLPTIIYLMKAKIPPKIFVAYLLLWLASATAVCLYFQSQDEFTGLFGWNSIAMFNWISNQFDSYWAILGCLFVVGIVEGLILFLLVNKKSMQYLCAFLIIVVVQFVFNDYVGIDYTEAVSRASWIDNVNVENVLNDTSDNLWLLDSGYPTYHSRLQSITGKRKVVVVEDADVDGLQDEYLFIASSMEDRSALDMYELKYRGYYYDVYYISKTEE